MTCVISSENNREPASSQTNALTHDNCINSEAVEHNTNIDSLFPGDVQTNKEFLAMHRDEFAVLDAEQKMGNFEQYKRRLTYDTPIKERLRKEELPQLEVDCGKGYQKRNGNGNSYEQKQQKQQPSMKLINRKWKYTSYILAVLIFIQMFAILFGLTQIVNIKTILTAKPLNKGLPAIFLNGNNEHQISQPGLPLQNWVLNYKHGSIEFEGKMINIKKAGLYQIYAQMFFYKNGIMFPERNLSSNPIMDRVNLPLIKLWYWIIIA